MMDINGTNRKLEAWRYSGSAIAIKFTIRETVIRLRRRDWFENQGRQNRRAHCRPLGRFSQDAANAFKRDGTKHGNAARFMRNDDTPQVLPTGVAVFPGWNRANLADKARKVGIPVWRIGAGSA
ncbi:hypothetical protein LHFGNBLO_006111 (plasmid) [Mesorhizobium sp. AR10]|nr:hypothetical protein LHFGNBLO_006111 [Mesorhizobium sp. AR10]